MLCTHDKGSTDFFGPLCVVSCYIDQKDINMLYDLHIDTLDLENIDEVINVAKILKDKLIYSLLILDNKHYNKMIEKGYKLSSIKADLYNRAMINVVKRVNHPIDEKIISSFLSPKKYYRYLKHKLLVVRDLEFKNNDHIGLKCARALAIYAHYQCINQLNKKLTHPLVSGKNKQANDAGILLSKAYGKKILSHVSKTNMPNYKQILEQLNA